MDVLKDVPHPQPTQPLNIVVVQPLGRDSAPVMAQVCLRKAMLRSCRHPVTNQEVFIHPHPINIVGDEYARARNELVNLVFQMEKDITAQAQAEENERAKQAGRRPGIAQTFKFDYIFWVDDDTMVPEDVVEQLLRPQAPIVSGLYFMRKPPYLPVAYQKTDDPAHPDRFWNLTAYPENTVIEVDAVGMGCALIETDVFRKLPQPWFAWQAMDAKPDETDHRALGEDMYFCIGRGEPVLTKHGSVPIEQILIGDEVMTHLGRWQKVQNTSVRSYTGKAISLKFYGDTKPIVTTPNHRYIIRRPDGGWRWQEAGQVTKGDFVGLPVARGYKPSVIRVADWLDVIPAVEKLHYYKNHEWLLEQAQTKSTRHIAKECGINQRLIVKELQLAGSHGQGAQYNRWGGPSPLVLADRPPLIGVTVPSQGARSALPDEIFITPELARCLGLYLAEGHTTSRTVVWSFGPTEQHLVDFVSEHISKLAGVPATVIDKGNGFQVVFGHTTLAHLFTALFGKGAANKRVPSCIFTWAEIDKQREFIAGYLEGDGSASGRNVSFSTVSQHIAYGIKVLLGTLGIPSSVYHHAVTAPSIIRGRRLNRQPVFYTGVVSQHWAVNTIRGWLAKTPIPNKSNNRSHIIHDKDFIWHEIISTSEIAYNGEVFNLSVEEDESYTVRGLAVHNCSLARKHGYKVLLSTGTICQHIGEYFYDAEMFKTHQVHYFRRPLPDRLAICFLVAPAPKQWDGRSIYTDPLGGSETAVGFLARSLARRHHVVYVICNTQEIVDVDGVCYRPYSALNGVLRQAWDALIVTRWPEAITWPLAKEIKVVMFWAHDVMNPDMLKTAYGFPSAPGQNDTDIFVALSQFHASISQVQGSRTKLMIIPNGVDLSLFKEEQEHIPGRMIWTSNPNRGLMAGVKILRKLRKRWPHLELHVYGRSSVYGWTEQQDPMYETPYLPDPEEPGVFLHEPVPKAELAKELGKSWAFFYTSTYPETSSIAALESQAAGTPVITVPYAALPDTVKGGVLDWDVERSVEYLMDAKNWRLCSVVGKQWAGQLDWDVLAQGWESVILEEIKEHRR